MWALTQPNIKGPFYNKGHMKAQSNNSTKKEKKQNPDNRKENK